MDLRRTFLMQMEQLKTMEQYQIQIGICSDSVVTLMEMDRSIILAPT